MSQKQALGFLSVILLSFLGASVSVCIKLTLTQLSPATLTWLRYLIGSLALTSFALLFKKSCFGGTRLWRVALVSLGNVGNVLFFAYGIKETSVSLSQIIYLAVPILTYLFSNLSSRENFSKKTVIGIFLGITGGMIGILARPTNIQNNSYESLGIFLLICGAISYALFLWSSRKFLTDVPIFTQNTVMTFSLLLACWIPMSITTDKIIPDISLSSYYWGLVLYYSLFASLTFYFLLQWIIKNYSATISSLNCYLAPFFGFGLAYLLLGEQINAAIVIGGVVSCAGVYLVTGAGKISA